MKASYFTFLFLVLALSLALPAGAQNPIIRDQFTADPTARVFNGKVYLYPSHDILAPADKGLRKDWFCMEDYHVFSSANLTDWTDHGVIVSQYSVPWVDSASYSMWAPDCIEKDGKYYFYFPGNQKREFGRGFTIGVAVADHPAGPFVPQAEPIKNVRGIDPCVLIDKDGQAYIYWSMGNIFVTPLKENMLELASETMVVKEMPGKGLKEGPFVFERNGIYYMTYPHVENKTERLEYAIGDHPLGPFTFAGVIMDEHPSGCWTNHHSIIEFEGQWYLFYHHNDYSPKFDKNRSTRIDSLFFNADGTIQKVTPTLRGVGVTHAGSTIEIDRYSLKSETGAAVAFLDTTDTFKGWKAILSSRGAWMQYNTVDFAGKKGKKVSVMARSENGSTLQVRAGAVDGPLIAEVKIPGGARWTAIETKVKKWKPGIHNLVVVLADDQPAEVDWLKFENRKP